MTYFDIAREVRLEIPAGLRPALLELIPGDVPPPGEDLVPDWLEEAVRAHLRALAHHLAHPAPGRYRHIRSTTPIA